MTLGYKTAGHGEHKVIALHGWFGDHTCYDPMLDSLSLGEFTYAFPAYRGYGLSKHLSGEYSMREISSDIIALANALKWTKFSLIGHSMGGKATQRLLIDAPLRIRRIVAITPAPACEVPFDAQGMTLFEGAATQSRPPPRHHRFLDRQSAVEGLGRSPGALLGGNLECRGVCRLFPRLAEDRIRCRGRRLGTCR